MAKKDKLMEEDYEIDMAPTSSEAINKLPGNITCGAEALSDYLNIPCELIQEYSGKAGRDFSSWPEEKFRDLVESVKKVGVIEAVTVRVSPKNPGVYEMLSGEHRWKASKAADLETIPAHVLRNCNDDLARSIFFLTNVLRRELRISDRVIGWHEYLVLSRYNKDADMIQKMIDEGILSEDFKTSEVGERQIYRYASLYKLPNEYLLKLDEGTLPMSAAMHLAKLSDEQLQTLIPFIGEIKSESPAAALRALANGELHGKKWNTEEIKRILAPKDKPVKVFPLAAKKATKVLKDRIHPEYYGQTDSIVSEALDLFFKKHPEMENKKKKSK